MSIHLLKCSNCAGLSYDANHRLDLVRDSGVVLKDLSYDARGNVTGNSTYTFTYNDASQLATVVNPSITYRYDGHGRRVLIDRAGKKTYTVHDIAGRLVYENRYDGASFDQQIRTDYVYLQNQIIAKRSLCGSLVDDDNDGLPNCYEDRFGLSAAFSGDATLDDDGDGLSNLLEYQLGTDPTAIDTDGDGISDAYEIAKVTLRANDPNGALDAELDGLPMLSESIHGSNPNGWNSEADGRSDGMEVANGADPITKRAANLAPILHPLLN